MVTCDVNASVHRLRLPFVEVDLHMLPPCLFMLLQRVRFAGTRKWDCCSTNRACLSLLVLAWKCYWHKPNDTLILFASKIKNARLPSNHNPAHTSHRSNTTWRTFVDHVLNFSTIVVLQHVAHFSHTKYGQDTKY